MRACRPGFVLMLLFGTLVLTGCLGRRTFYFVGQDAGDGLTLSDVTLPQDLPTNDSRVPRDTLDGGHETIDLRADDITDAGDAGLDVPEAGFEVSDAGFEVSDAEFEVSDAEMEVADAEDVPPADVPCVPDCLLRHCGDDGCGGSCGVCEEGMTCDEVHGACVPPHWVIVENGQFLMGTSDGSGDYPTEFCRGDDEGPLHEVVISRPLLVSDHETLQTEWEEFAQVASPAYFGANGPKAYCTDSLCPVEQVSWYEAVTWCNLRSVAEGLESCYALDNCVGTLGGGCGTDTACAGDYVCDVTFHGVGCEGYRLPTEAEWEFLARAGTLKAYPYPPPDGSYNSSDACDCESVSALEASGWYCGNANDKTRPVRSLAANGWGLHDVLGNVYEFTQDAYDQYFYFTLSQQESPAVDPLCTEGEERVHRGGAWGAYSRWNRSGYRSQHFPYHRSRQIGFRAVRTIAHPH